MNTAGNHSVAAIYLRTSRKDGDPTNQETACRTLAAQRGYTEVTVFIERRSAWKNDGQDRVVYHKIKDMANAGKINAVVVWALDRWVRSMGMLKRDMAYLSTRGVKLHSVRDAWLEEINIDGVMGEWVREAMTGLLGMAAQFESDRKSARLLETTKRNTQKGGLTMSYKDNKWGRKQKIPGLQQKIKDHMELPDGHRDKISEAEFCRNNGVNRGSYYYYKKKIKAQKGEIEE